MTENKIKKVLGLSLLVWTTFAYAEETAFTTHTELGYVSTSGNTNTKSASIDFVGKQKWDEHSIQLDVDYLYGEQEGIETNNKLITVLNYDYLFSERVGFNYITGYKEDRFSGFDYQFYTGPGIKYDAIKNDTHTLALQSNIVYSVDKEMDKFYTDPAYTIETPYPYSPVKGAFKDPASGKKNDYSSYLLQAHYLWNITKTFKFTQDLSYRSSFESSDNYFVQSKTGVASKISDIFSMGINYKVDYVNQPPAGNVRTDKTFTASLIIDY